MNIGTVLIVIAGAGELSHNLLESGTVSRFSQDSHNG
jgi:hypothetical protein